MIKTEYPYPNNLWEGEYPTQESLDYLMNWGNRYTADQQMIGVKWGDQDLTDLITFIETIWWMPDMGFKYDKGLLELHTLGWSSNEEIIDVLRNTILWHRCYRMQTVGGHYFFKVTDEGYDFKIKILKDEQN